MRTVRKNVLSLIKLRSTATVLITLLLYTAVARLLFAAQVVEISENNSCVFLSTDTQDPVRQSLEKAILNAKKSVCLIIYSLSDGRIVRALRTAAAHGVEVSVIHDPVWTPDGAFLLGEKIKSYPRRSKGLMHNKLLSIDHHDAWIGSANMTSGSLLEQGNLVVAIRSEAIASAIERLAQTMIERTDYTEGPLHVNNGEETFTFFFHPFHGEAALQALKERIDKASQRIFVAMFTFTHPDLAEALALAKKRGVDVRVIMDQESSKQASHQIFVRLQREGVPCGYRTKQGLLHSKVALIDTTLVAGSCNWTKAGFASNHEAMLFIEPLTNSQQQWLDVWWKSVEHNSSLQ